MSCQFVYIIGPGGAGKSTAGRLAADILGWKVIDLDEEFCHSIMNIRVFIKTFGYEEYVLKNSLFFRQLRERITPLNTLFILSSGFLSTDVCEEIIKYNRKVVKETGTSVLIMPSPDYDISLKYIIDRQLSRGLGLNAASETLKFKQRFNEYIKIADAIIFSVGTPEEVASLIIDEVKMAQ